MHALTPARRRHFASRFKNEYIYGYVFALPLILGLLMFTVYPLVESVRYSFMEYNVLETPRYIGGGNYAAMVRDELFWKSMGNTLYYVALSVPIQIAISLSVALLLNLEVKGLSVFRTLYYMPSIVPLVASTILWGWMFNPKFGILSNFVAALGLAVPGWLSDPAMVKNTLIIMSLWTSGSSMIIYLAGLQAIPRVYYEAAQLDGANALGKLVNITLPMLTPSIFFQLIMGLINGFQVFTQSYILTGGGPNNASLFYVFYLFNNAFSYWKMGYACAMGWVLVAIVLTFTLLNFYLSRKWVLYDQV